MEKIPNNFTVSKESLEHAKQIRRIPPLTEKEQIELAKHFDLSKIISEKAKVIAQELFSKSVEELKEMALSGDADAAIYLGKLYFQGEDIKRCDFKAGMWLAWAAANGNSKATFSLSKILRQGDIEEDKELSYKLFEMGGEQAKADTEGHLMSEAIYHEMYL